MKYIVYNGCMAVYETTQKTRAIKYAEQCKVMNAAEGFNTQIEVIGRECRNDPDPQTVYEYNPD